MEKVIQIEWVAANLEEARSISLSLVEKRLVACAQIVPEIESVYLWKGKIETSKEVKVYLKSSKKHFLQIKEFILRNVSYELPEILQITIEGHAPYLKWIEDVTRNPVINS